MLGTLYLLGSLATLFLLQFAWQYASVLVARKNGIHVTSVQIGIGPTLYQKNFGNECWYIKTIPLISSVQVRTHFNNNYEDNSAENLYFKGSFHSATNFVRFVLYLVGPLCVFLTSCIMLSLAIIFKHPQLSLLHNFGQNPELQFLHQSSSISGQSYLAFGTSSIYIIRLFTFQRMEGWGGPFAFIITSTRFGESSFLDWATLQGMAGIMFLCLGSLPIPPSQGFQFIRFCVCKCIGIESTKNSKPIIILTYIGLIFFILMYGRVFWLDTTWAWSQF